MGACVPHHALPAGEGGPTPNELERRMILDKDLNLMTEKEME